MELCIYLVEAVIQSDIQFRKEGQPVTLQQWGLRALLKGPTAASLSQPRDLNRRPSDHGYSVPPHEGKHIPETYFCQTAECKVECGGTGFDADGVTLRKPPQSVTTIQCLKLEDLDSRVKQT